MERPSRTNAGNRVGGVCRRWGRAGVGLAFVLGVPLTIAVGALAEEPPPASPERLKLGLELFTHDWEPNDPRCRGGDGLGPVYNATSCVACHGQGGPGGAGSKDMNVEVVSLIGGHISDVRGETAVADRSRVIGDAVAVDIPGMRPNRFAFVNRVLGNSPVAVEIPGIRLNGDAANGIVDMHVSTEATPGRVGNAVVISANGKTLKAREFDLKTAPDREGLVLSTLEGSIEARSFTVRPDDEPLMKIHPGLTGSPSVVLHHYGVDDRYDPWRWGLKTRIALLSPEREGSHGFCGGALVASERNSPPLFGLGLIEALPDAVLIATAAQEHPSVRGRVNRMTNGRIGRFGWKAQTTNLRDFVLGACASELGLEIPDHRQATSPLDPDVRAKALDLTQDDCEALVAYVRALPAPVTLEDPYRLVVEAGRKSFKDIGCADCHRPSLGNIKGIYSDLLMHDMGMELVSVTITPYYGPTEVRDIPRLPPGSLADGTEWRTPPLWGYRDSGPYLHDGRARNLHEVVIAHGGQASQSRKRFKALPHLEKTNMEHFLNSLVAPPEAEPEDRPNVRRSVLGPSSSPPTPKPTTPARIDPGARAEQESLAESRLKLAQNLEKMDKPQGALVFYREIVRDEPDSVAARTASARIKALTGGAEGRKD